MTLGTIDRSSVLRVESSKVRMPRSQRITCRLPWARMYSADMSRSFTVALIPRLSSTGSRVLPTSLSRSKFCMLRAPIWKMSAYCSTSSTWRGSMTSVTTGMPSCSPVGLEDLEPLLAQPLEAVRAGARLERPAAKDVGPGLLHPRGHSSRSGSLSIAHGPAIIPRWPPPILTPFTSMTESSLVELAAGQLERLEDRDHLLDPGDRLQRLDLELVLVADDPDDRPRDALAEVRRQAQGLDPLEDMLDHVGRRMRLQYDDHRG